MEVPQGKHAWMVKIGEKGQFVIPKEARDIFGFHPGDELLVLGDDERGIAILPKVMQREYMPDWQAAYGGLPSASRLSRHVPS